MFKRTQSVIINNRGTKEFGSVVKTYRRKDVRYYDIQTERGILFEGLTENKSFPVYVETDLSKKMNSNKLKPVCTN